MQTVTVPAGQRAQIILADGTRVWLNSKSTMKYAANFGRNERNVELDGEAYFEVDQKQEYPILCTYRNEQGKSCRNEFQRLCLQWEP